MPFFEESLGEIQIGIAQELLVAGLLFEVVLGKEIAQELLIEVVVVEDLFVPFILDVTRRLTQHSIQIPLLVGLLQKFVFRFFVLQQRVDLLND